jgi:hypothetical protein
MFHDGCTAGPLSDWLNGTIRVCCDAHDLALDHTVDLWTFISGNAAFGWCVAQTGGPVLALLCLAAVSSPIGWLYYRFGPKRKPTEGDGK